MYLNLFSNPIQAIARIGLTYIVRNLSLPTLTVTLITSLYHIVRISINNVGIIPTFNTLRLIRRYLNTGPLTFVGLQNLFQNNNILTVQAILNAIEPFWDNVVTRVTLRSFTKLFNLFFFTLFFTIFKKLMFRMFYLLFTSLISIMASVFYFELPSIETIKDSTKDLIKLTKKLDTEVNQTFWQRNDSISTLMVCCTCFLIATVTILVGVSLTDWENLQIITVNTFNSITNFTTWPIRISYRGCMRFYQWLFPPSIT